LHVIPAVAPRYGGPSAAIVPMCRTLSALGVEPLIATTNADGKARLPVPLADPTSWKGVSAIFFERRFSESYKYSPSLAAWLDANVAAFDGVHIHALLSHACLAAAAACVRRGVPYIVRPLGTLVPWSLSQRAWKKRLLLAVKGRAVLERAAAVHYTSENERRAVEATLALINGVVVPLGIDPGMFDLPVAAARDEDPYVLAMSRVHPKKNLEALIAAFSEISGRRDRWRLVIAGDGDADYIDALKRLAGDRGAARRVSFLGWIDGPEKLELLQRASVFALCSKHENFGLSVLEAMALGVPALVSRHVDLASEIDRTRAGWVVDDLDGGLRGSLDEAISDGQERAARSRAAREAAKPFAWPAIGLRLVTMYDTCISASASSALSNP
jgi:glycosyltransferase involved in cell wall biosynthesis